MPRKTTIEFATPVLHTLTAALRLVDTGIVLFGPDLRALYLNACFIDMWSIPDALRRRGLTLDDCNRYMRATAWRGAAPDAHSGECAIDAGGMPPRLIELTDGRFIRVRCDRLPDGHRILTCCDITDDMRRGAATALEHLGAEMRFANETLEGQAAHLAMLAEAAEANAQRAEAACLLLEHEIEERRQLETQLRKVATLDGLTGALNRAAFLAAGQRELDRARRQGTDLGVLMLDADHFKSINDRYGHAGGDMTLQHLVGTCRRLMRSADIIGRLGGEEFAILVPGATEDATRGVGERLRTEIAKVALPHGDRIISLTISIGMALARPSDASIEQVIARSDAALYEAKASGRNRVVPAAA